MKLNAMLWFALAMLCPASASAVDMSRCPETTREALLDLRDAIELADERGTVKEDHLDVVEFALIGVLESAPSCEAARDGFGKVGRTLDQLAGAERSSLVPDHGSYYWPPPAKRKRRVRGYWPPPGEASLEERREVEANRNDWAAHGWRAH